MIRVRRNVVPRRSAEYLVVMGKVRPTEKAGWTELAGFITEFNKESDRAAVILGAAKLDIQLYQLIQSALKPATGNTDELLDGDSPLSTFSSRIHIAYRLGLVDEEFARALHLVRRIRNSFAHEIASTTLTTGAHRDRIRELTAPLRRREKNFAHLLKVMAKEHEGASAEFRAMIAFMGARLERALMRGVTVYKGDPVAHFEILVNEEFRGEKIFIEDAVNYQRDDISRHLPSRRRIRGHV